MHRRRPRRRSRRSLPRPRRPAGNRPANLRRRLVALRERSRWGTPAATARTCGASLARLRKAHHRPRWNAAPGRRTRFAGGRADLAQRPRSTGGHRLGRRQPSGARGHSVAVRSPMCRGRARPPPTHRPRQRTPPAPRPTSSGATTSGPASRGQIGNTGGQGANIRSEPGAVRSRPARRWLRARQSMCSDPSARSTDASGGRSAIRQA